MGDAELLFNRLNLSPVNTILLVALIFILKFGFKRLEKVERRAAKHTVKLAVISNTLRLEWDTDEGDDEEEAD